MIGAPPSHLADAPPKRSDIVKSATAPETSPRPAALSQRTMDRPDGKLDAAQWISADLGRVQRERRAHFAPALWLSIVAVAASLVAMGVRPDLWSQPWPPLVGQVVLWVVCLLVFPAIGVGLLFPSRPLQIGIIAVGVLGTLGSTIHWPVDAGSLDRSAGCFGLTVGVGLLLLGIGLVSGAFVARRRSSAVVWIAAGLALAALNVVTWHCPQTGLAHVATAHLASAAGLIVAATIAGLWIRGRDA